MEVREEIASRLRHAPSTPIFELASAWIYARPIGLGSAFGLENKKRRGEGGRGGGALGLAKV